MLVTGGIIDERFYAFYVEILFVFEGKEWRRRERILKSFCKQILQCNPTLSLHTKIRIIIFNAHYSKPTFNLKKYRISSNKGPRALIFQYPSRGGAYWERAAIGGNTVCKNPSLYVCLNWSPSK